MPNIKSAIKRTAIIKKKTARNSMIKTGYRTAVKAYEVAYANGDADAAKEAYREAAKKLDMAAQKGVITKKTAARKKSNMARRLKSLTSGAPKAAKKTTTKKTTTTKKAAEKVEEVKEEKAEEPAEE